MDVKKSRFNSFNRSIDNSNELKAKNKRLLSDQVFNKDMDYTKSTNTKKHKGDLICVICHGIAFGYNFDQISCSSCKEFFRRNALLPMEKTKCINEKNCSINIRCEIRFDMKRKCQRCRLLKCFESGMRTDNLLTAEEKILKQLHMEQNRRIHSTQLIDRNDQDTNAIGASDHLLTNNDRACLTTIEDAYISSIKSIPSASSVLSFEPSLHKTFSLTDMIEIEKFIAIKLINFLRLIPEFQCLHEEDRLALVKYNLIPLIILRDGLIYDLKTNLFCDDTRSSPLSLRDLIFAENYRSLAVLFYGYEYVVLYSGHIRSIINIVDNNTLIIKTLMLILIFLKGISINDERVWLFIDRKNVFNAHLKYTDLLFRYLIDRYSFNTAVMKMMQIVQFIFNTQAHAQIYQEKVQKESAIIEIHPLMKSLLGIS